MQKKRVLIVIYSLRRGGIEMSALRFQLHMSPEKYEFVYYVQDAANNEKSLEKAATDSGAKIVAKPAEVDNRVKEYGFLKRIIREERIDIVHAHMLFHSGMVMRAAYRCGVKVRIAHSHLSKSNQKVNWTGKVYRAVMRRWLNRYATDRLACSEAAGDYLYGQNFIRRGGKILYNGIDMSLYRWNREIRETKRREMRMEAQMVVGHVGSIYWIKNQLFLIDVFREILETTGNAVLLLCGETRDGGEVQSRVKELGLEDRVRFLGTRDDVPELLMAMDVLVFPSRFEALPLVPIEAQAAGLPCLLSDRVTREVQKNENVAFLPLEAGAGRWAREAIRLAQGDREKVSTGKLASSFDIDQKAKQLERIYDASDAASGT